MREPRGRVIEAIRRVGEESVYTSVVVAGELRFGVAKKKSDRLSAGVEALLQRMTVARLEPPVDRIYADLRSMLEASGRVIGTNDLWIAAQAMQNGSVVVTDNVREFGRVPAIKVENWLRA